MIRRRQPEQRAIFVLTLRAASGVDGIRALRLMLKSAKRRFGLIAIDAFEKEGDAPINAADTFCGRWPKSMRGKRP